MSQTFETLGNVELLSQNALALFASRHTPQPIIPEAQKLFTALTRLPLALAGGWQAPLEKKLLRSIDPAAAANYLYYLAKDINTFQPDRVQQRLLNQRKLLILSPGIHAPRPSAKEISRRDTLLFAQVRKILFFYIAPSGRLEKYFNYLLEQAFQVFLLKHPLNAHLFNSDLVLLNSENAQDLLSV